VTWLWYLTRASGAVALVLLTLSLCLGIAGTLRWRSRRVPKFTVADLHRNMTLLAVVFLGVHIATSIADTYAPIGLKDAVVPFTSAYRPFWLGLGALSFDVMLALIVTSLLRIRIGLRTWRAIHWLAYACWPLALFHSLGTGSDPRAGWLQLLAALSVALVLAAVAVRLARSRVQPALRLAAGAAAVVATLLAALWFETGPNVSGWAAKAGTPASLLKHGTVSTRVITAATLPSTFDASLSGTVTETGGSDGVVDVHLDGALRGGLRGEVKVVLEGFATRDGGVSMTASGVAFAAAGTSVYQGQVVEVQGERLTARVDDGSGHALLLALDLQLSQGSDTLAGTLHGSVE
jgi:Ferric reductase like transmembrane component